MASDEFWNVGWVDNFVLKPRILFRIDTKISFNLSLIPGVPIKSSDGCE